MVDCEQAEDVCLRGYILLVLMHGRDFKLIHKDSTAWAPPEENSVEEQCRTEHT